VAAEKRAASAARLRVTSGDLPEPTDPLMEGDSRRQTLPRRERPLLDALQRIEVLEAVVDELSRQLAEARPETPSSPVVAPGPNRAARRAERKRR
jgi:hypothetical protein